MSSSRQRASAQTMGPCTSRATAVTLSKSPREAAGNPASMTSTPSSASARATRSFSGWVMLQPGDCSPSRSVVSKISTRSGSEVIDAGLVPASGGVPHRSDAFGACALRRLSLRGLCSGALRNRTLRSGALHYRTRSRGRRGAAAFFLQPGHACAQRRAYALDLPVDVLREELLVIRPALCVLADPLPREAPAAHFLEHLAHLVLHALVDDAGPARQVTVLGRLADELVHLGEPAFMQEVHDQLQLVQAFVVGDLGLIARLDERLEALHHKLGRAAAQHRLLAKEIGLGLFREGGLDHSTACAADAVRVGEGARVCLTRSVLRDREQTRHPATFLVLATHQVPGTLRGNQDHIEILGGFDLTEVDVEAVGEQQYCAGLESLADASVELLLHRVGNEHRHEVRALHRLRGLCNRESLAARLFPARAAAAHAHHDIETGVLQTERVCASLAAVAQDGDARALERLAIDIFLRIELHRDPSSIGPRGRYKPYKKPRSGLCRCGV